MNGQRGKRYDIGKNIGETCQSEYRQTRQNGDIFCLGDLPCLAAYASNEN